MPNLNSSNSDNDTLLRLLILYSSAIVLIIANFILFFVGERSVIRQVRQENVIEPLEEVIEPLERAIEQPLVNEIDNIVQLLAQVNVRNGFFSDFEHSRRRG
ncbi:hypothetical protein K6025_05335 [Ehrlichia sp. JZT12]